MEFSSSAVIDLKVYRYKYILMQKQKNKNGTSDFFPP
jgi:hypothetical protein